MAHWGEREQKSPQYDRFAFFLDRFDELQHRRHRAKCHRLAANDQNNLVRSADELSELQSANHGR